MILFHFSHFDIVEVHFLRSQLSGMFVNSSIHEVKMQWTKQ